MHAAQLFGVNCLWIGPEVFDPTGLLQQKLLINLLANDTRQPIDGLAISVTREEAIQPIIDIAVQAGIPVVTFDSDAPTSKRSAYIGTNNTFLGVQLGRIVKQLLPNGGYYAILSGTSPNIKDRERGLRYELLSAVVKNHEWIELPNSPSNAENGTVSIQQIYEFTFRKPTPTAILPVMGAPMRSGLWKKMVDDLRSLNITFVSGDALQVQLDFLEDDYVQGLVGQLPYEMGFQAIEVLLNLVQHNFSGILSSHFLGTNILTHVYVPLILPELVINTNLVGDLKIVGDILFGLITIVVLGFVIWTVKNRNVRVVQASQPMFLAMIAVGVFILASSLIPMSFDDRGNPSQLSDRRKILICMSIPWLGSMGFAITFAALYTKLRRINRLFHSSDSFLHVRVTQRDVIAPLFMVLAANAAILIAWTIVDPLVYVRQDFQATDGWGRALASYGTCRSNNVAAYLVPLALVNTGVLLLANWNAYRARVIETEFSESKYLAIAMASILQAIMCGIPVLFLVRDAPKAFYLVLTFCISITCMAVLLAVFVPKIIIAEDFAKYSLSEQERMIHDSIRNSMRSVHDQNSSSRRPSRRHSRNLSDLCGELSFTPSMIRDLEEQGATEDFDVYEGNTPTLGESQRKPNDQMHDSSDELMISRAEKGEDKLTAKVYGEDE